MLTTLIHSAQTIRAHFAPDSWQARFFESFHHDLGSKEKTFPCTFGTLASERGGLRFLFLDDFRSPADIDLLGQTLLEYIGQYKSIDRMTSLVCFFNPAAKLETERQYFAAFWNVLQQLHERDQAPWPAGIPTDPNHADWEFSFGGDTFFVVCNTPLHEHRLSRRAMGFYITFQPRWVFEGITGDTKAGQSARRVIRKHLRNYDRIDLYPKMGNYGDPDNREWQQYFIPDRNETELTACPFHFAGENGGRGERPHEVTSTMTAPRIVRGAPLELRQAVAHLLPPIKTNSVEVQFDLPNREHKTHQHPTDETLLVVEGEITFHWGEEQATCKPGDRLLLPFGTPHSSVAGDDGCLYVIAQWFVTNE